MKTLDARIVVFRFPLRLLLLATLKREINIGEYDKKAEIRTQGFTHYLHSNKNMINSMWLRGNGERCGRMRYIDFRDELQFRWAWLEQQWCCCEAMTKSWNTYNQIDNDFSMLSTRFVLIIHVAERVRWETSAIWRRRTARAGNYSISLMIPNPPDEHNFQSYFSAFAFVRLFFPLRLGSLHILDLLRAYIDWFHCARGNGKKNESKKKDNIRIRKARTLVLLSIFHKFYLVVRLSLAFFFFVRVDIAVELAV